MLALLLASCVAQAAPAVPEAAAALARGDAAHAALDYGAARREYEQALALEPAGVAGRWRLAHVLNDLGEEAAARGSEAEARALFEAALALAERLQSDAPDRPEGHHAVAATLGSLTPFLSGPGKVRRRAADRRVGEARDRARPLPGPCLRRPRNHLPRALVARRLRARPRAGGARGPAEGHARRLRGLLRAAVALDPDDPFNRYQLALTLEKLGRPLEAATELERALARPDREARDRRNRADAEARLRRLGTVDSKGR